MTMSTDEKKTLFHVCRFDPAARLALLNAAEFVLDNGGPEEEELEDLKRAYKTLEESKS